MTGPRRKETISSRVLTDLRGAIVRGEMSPGTHINLDQLRDRFATSISPLREALARLTGDGLVLFEDQRGFRVAPASPEEFSDLSALHADLEVTALREAVAVGGMDWESGVIRTLHRLDRTSFLSDPAGWSAAHAGFHNALISGANRPFLLQSCTRLADLVARYRIIAATDGPRPEDQAEHEAIASAAAQRRTEAACQALRDHLGREAELVLRSLDPAPRP